MKKCTKCVPHTMAPWCVLCTAHAQVTSVPYAHTLYHIICPHKSCREQEGMKGRWGREVDMNVGTLSQAMMLYGTCQVTLRGVKAA